MRRGSVREIAGRRRPGPVSNANYPGNAVVVVVLGSGGRN
jgi:hypothetical protein